MMKKHRLMIWLKASTHRMTVVLYRLKDQRLRSLHCRATLAVLKHPVEVSCN